jgi:hypothetical protein
VFRDFSEASHWCEKADRMEAGDKRPSKAVSNCRIKRGYPDIAGILNK